MHCAHRECSCLNPTYPLNGEFFCDSACAANAADGDAGCGCLHPNCEGAAATTRRPPSANDGETAQP